MHAARTATQTRQFEHITAFLSQLKWLPVERQLLHYRDTLITQKHINGPSLEYSFAVSTDMTVSHGIITSLTFATAFLPLEESLSDSDQEIMRKRANPPAP